MARERADEGRIEVDGPGGRGAIVFDRSRLGQAQAAWFDPDWWGSAARPVGSGGRGSAWFVDAPFGACVLRHYRRGGLAARLSRAGYVWHGEARVRSVAEFRLTREVLARGLDVPVPIAAWYVRSGLHYRAALLMARLPDTRTLADAALAGDAPWEAAGRLVARMHRVGLDHADLNADNLLFDDGGRGWVIDLDRGALRTGVRTWREANLARLLRSLHKRRGARDPDIVERDFARLRAAYDAALEDSDDA
ncbi:3-deoxy-D-manno-octulosonic acid kinase [Lysobacter humi (ex Lee et al. 2017)]